ncbi:MAG: peptide deformylase [Candidatus Yanofskybacteria bacterium RIFCSPHIGHO2_02_FULL_43_22]|uniref:Peptide deformylase n=1 Tax=Candidatus Yanofskybacteria bacterium RIFCSPHIGHO2_02_FULL_43_22 TaxID=1802681 RepID=A0A1F8FLV1_9BACT|nr:MAG: peptide deformylase [Candidatus Yanofskybacteria bacterium RIFCSPHIGHO2_02_FULL_43_22]
MEITKIPNKILAKNMEKVAVDDIKKGLYKDLVSDMKKAMIENNGVGLAANQVGKDLSVFVVDQKLAKENSVPDVFINPEITEYSKEASETEEGCLSMPGYWVPIKRSRKIRIKAVGENGNKIKFKARGFLARVLQHETDHLNGITIRDRNTLNAKFNLRPELRPRENQNAK